MPARPSCSVCGKPATVMCSRCRGDYYCSEDHKLQEWPRHRLTCGSCKVDLSPEHGHCLKATKDITKGEIIFVETPFITGPAHFSLLPSCIGCSCALPTWVDALPCCLNCQWPACSFDCAQLSVRTGHDVECLMLELVEDKTWSCLLPYRCMLLQKSNPRMWKWLEVHSSTAVAKQADKSKHDSVALELESSVTTILQKNSSFLPLEYSAETFKKIHAVLDVYGLYFWASCAQREFIGLYETAGFLKVSCVANTRTDFYNFSGQNLTKDFGRVVITAIRNIQRGEVLSCPYAITLSSTYFRQAELARRNLVCRCPRCLDPREMGLDLGTMKCTSCPGLILPVDTLNIATCNWACDKNCGETRTAIQVSERLNYFFKLQRDLAKPDLIASLQPETMEVLLTKFLAELHPYHELCVLLKSLMMQIYSSSDLKGGHRGLSDELLERRAVLCRDVLDSIIRLGRNTYRVENVIVVTIKMFAETQFALTRRKFSFGKLTSDQATRNLVECLKFLVPALKIFHDTQLEYVKLYRMRMTLSRIVLWAKVNGLEIPGIVVQRKVSNQPDPQ